MSNELPLRIFLASPSDLAIERDRVKATVERYNSLLRNQDNRPFEVVGWERTRGTANRPQEEINQLIGNVDFMVVLFKEAWGSEPGGPLGYTSGTEEELFTGLLALGTKDRPLQDIWVGFVSAHSPSEEVLALKSQIQNQHALLYDIIDGDLDTKLTERLRDWQQTSGQKTTKWIGLVPRSGKDVIGAAQNRANGELLISLGQAEAGIQKLKLATELGGPREHITYARALGRRGQFTEALNTVAVAISQVLNDSIQLNSELAGDVFTTEAELLRKQGSDLEAINRLGVILGGLDGQSQKLQDLRARIYDQRGLANHRVGRLEEAKADFDEAFRLRTESGRNVDIAQSLLNLLRLSVKLEDLDAASTYAESLQDSLRRTTPSDLHANAWTAIAQLRRRQQRPHDGIEVARQALSLNRQTGHKTGIAISLLVLGQCLRDNGEIDEAMTCFKSSLSINQEIGNELGEKKAQWQINHLTNVYYTSE